MNAVEVDQDRLQEPARYQPVATLRDWSRFLLRAIQPGDAAAEAEFVARLSSESRYFRFFRAKQGLSDEELRHFTEVDFVHHEALVAKRSDEPSEPILAAGRYVPSKDLPAGSAEVAFAVDDALHGRGMATLLLGHFAHIPRANGITRFLATVLPRNRTGSRCLRILDPPDRRVPKPELPTSFLSSTASDPSVDEARRIELGRWPTF